MKGKNNEGRGMKYKKWGQTKTEDDKGANYYSTVLLVIFNQMAVNLENIYLNIRVSGYTPHANLWAWQLFILQLDTGIKKDICGR